jgi:hypothetical protein
LTKFYFALSLSFDSPPFQQPSGSNNNTNNGNSESIYGPDFEDGDDVDMSAPTATAATEGSQTATTKAKKDPSGVSTLVSAMKNNKLQPPLCFNMADKFPFLLSPTGYFRDGTKSICVDFWVISMDEDKYKVDLANGGTVIKLLSMKIPTWFMGYEHLVNELN